MKKFFRTIVPVTLFFLLCSFGIHKFYVAIYQVNYVSKKNEFQITARIFTDDLEKALEKKYKTKVYLATPKEVKEVNTFLNSYLNEKMALTINGRVNPMNFLAKETEDNVTICYLTVPISEKIKTIEIYNSVLTELFSDQQNIIHFNMNGNKKTALLTNENISDKFETD